jgi:hypothetical protein
MGFPRPARPPAPVALPFATMARVLSEPSHSLSQSNDLKIEAEVLVIPSHDHDHTLTPLSPAVVACSRCAGKMFTITRLRSLRFVEEVPEGRAPASGAGTTVFVSCPADEAPRRRNSLPGMSLAGMSMAAATHGGMSSHGGRSSRDDDSEEGEEGGEEGEEEGEEPGMLLLTSLAAMGGSGLNSGGGRPRKAAAAAAEGGGALASVLRSAGSSSMRAGFAAPAARTERVLAGAAAAVSTAGARGGGGGQDGSGGEEEEDDDQEHTNASLPQVAEDLDPGSQREGSGVMVDEDEVRGGRGGRWAAAAPQGARGFPSRPLVGLPRRCRPRRADPSRTAPGPPGPGTPRHPACPPTLARAFPLAMLPMTAPHTALLNLAPSFEPLPLIGGSWSAWCLKPARHVKPAPI